MSMFARSAPPSLLVAQTNNTFSSLLPVEFVARVYGQSLLYPGLEALDATVAIAAIAACHSHCSVYISGL